MEYITAGMFLDVHLMFLTLEVLVRELNRESGEISIDLKDF